MHAARTLRWIGRVCAGIGALGAFVMLPLAWLLLGYKPLRTVGTHGMLPSDFHSLFFGGIFLGLGGYSAALLATGLLCAFGSRLARISAVVIGPLALIVGAACQVYSPNVSSDLRLALAPLTVLPTQAFAAYLTALGVASFRASRARAAGSRTTRWLTQPELLGGIVLGLTLLVNRALYPFTLMGVAERSDACSQVADIAGYCGSAIGVTFVPRDSSLLVLRRGANGPLLEKYPAAPPRKPTWSQTLATGTGDQQWRPLAVSSDGSIVLTASSKGVERFDGMTGAPRGVLGSCDAKEKEPPIMAVSPDGTTLAIGNQSVCLLPAASANIAADTRRLSSLSSPVTGMAFDPSGARLWVQTAKELAAWDVATRERVVTLNMQQVWQFALSSDGKYVVTSRDWTSGIELWNAETGAPAGRVPPALVGKDTLSRPLTFMADDRRVVALSTVGGYYILDPIAGVASPQRDPDTVYRTLASSADGRWVAFARVGGYDPTPSFKFVPTEQLRLQP